MNRDEEERYFEGIEDSENLKNGVSEYTGELDY